MMIQFSSVYVLLIPVALADLPRISQNLIGILPWETLVFSIIDRYRPYDVQIITENSTVSDEFLQRIRVPMKLLCRNLHEHSLLLLLPQTQEFVTNVLDTMVNFTKSKYTFLVNCNECVPTTWILEQCWQRNLLNVAVIPIKSSTLPIYTYFPFKDGTCFDSTPVLLGVLSNNLEFKLDLFPKDKIRNLHLCPLKVSTFNMHPLIHVQDNKMSGLLSPVYNAVERAMNFSSEFVYIEGKEWAGSVAGTKKTGVRGHVFTGEAHLGFHFLQPIDFDYLDYDSLAMTGCVTWCLAVQDQKISIWRLVVGEFAPLVWLMLFLSALAIIATDSLLQRLEKWKRSSKEAAMYLNVWSALSNHQEERLMYRQYPSGYFGYHGYCCLS